MNCSDLAHFRAADLAAPRLGAFCSRGASFHALAKRLAAKTPEPGTGVLALLLFSDLVDPIHSFELSKDVSLSDYSFF